MQVAAARVADALEGARFVAFADPLDRAAVDALLAPAPDVVVNCLAANPSTPAWVVPGLGTTNVAALPVLFEAAIAAGVPRVLTFGSGFEFAVSDAPIPEDAPIAPTTLYGASKAAGSVIAGWYAAHSALEVCVVRPFSMYGPRERVSRFVPAVVTAALDGRPIEMSSGRQVRDYLYIDDAADAVARLAAVPVLPPAVNLAGGERHTLLEFAAIAAEVGGAGAPLRPGARPENPGDRPVFLADTTRARTLLGWEPSFTLRSGLARTADWYRTHRDFWEMPA